MAMDGLATSGADLIALMLNVAGLVDGTQVDPMLDIRRTFDDVSQTLERLKKNHDMVAHAEQEKLMMAYKGFLLQSGHEIEELRKKYNVENLKLMYSQTFKSLEKAFMSLKAENIKLLREKDVLDKQTKNDALELDDAKKEISRLEEALKTTGKQNTGYRLLGELKAAKLRDAEERLTELEIYGQIETPREVARLLFKSLIPVPEQKVNLQLKQAVRDSIEKLLDVETPISGADLSKSLLQAFEAFTHTLAHLNKKAKDTIASTRLRLTRTTDMIDKLQGSTYGHISTLLTKSIWQILQKEIERLKIAAIQKKHADNAHLNHSYSGEEPEIDPSELYPSENMPYLNQAVFPDPKAYTPSVALQDLPLLDDLPSRDNTALVDKILTNKKIIDTLIKAIEGKLAEITAFPKSGPKKAYRINRTLIGRSVDSRDKSVSGTYDDRVLSRDPSQIGDSSSNRYNNSSSTRRPGDSVATPGHYDIYLKDLPLTTAGTFNPTPNLSLDMTNILPQIDAFDKKVLITPPDGTTSRTNRPAILRDAKTLSTKFNRIIRDDESISDGVYLLVDSELKKRKKKQKAIK